MKYLKSYMNFLNEGTTDAVFLQNISDEFLKRLKNQKKDPITIRFKYKPKFLYIYFINSDFDDFYNYIDFKPFVIPFAKYKGGITFKNKITKELVSFFSKKELAAHLKRLKKEDVFFIKKQNKNLKINIILNVFTNKTSIYGKPFRAGCKTYIGKNNYDYTHTIYINKNEIESLSKDSLDFLIKHEINHLFQSYNNIHSAIAKEGCKDRIDYPEYNTGLIKRNLVDRYQKHHMDLIRKRQLL